MKFFYLNTKKVNNLPTNLHIYASNIRRSTLHKYLCINSCYFLLMAIVGNLLSKPFKPEKYSTQLGKPSVVDLLTCRIRRK